MYEAEETQWWYAGMRAISLALLDRRAARGGRAGAILDAGCGTGNNLVHFAALRAARSASTSPRTRCASAARAAWPAARASCSPCPSPTRRFDCVTSFDVLYHRWVTDDAAAVRELARVLRPGGLLLVRVPALEDAVGRARRGGALAPSLHARARCGAPARGGPRGAARSPTRTRCSSPCWPLRRTLDRLTGPPRLRRRASCPRPWSGRSAALLRAGGAAGAPRLAARGRQRVRARAQAGGRRGVRVQSPRWTRRVSERERVADELRRVRDGVRDAALPSDAAPRCPPPRPCGRPEPMPPARRRRRRRRAAAARQRGAQPAVARRRAPRRAAAAGPRPAPAARAALVEAPGGLQLPAGAVRQRAARLRRRAPRRDPPPLRPRARACTAATWTRSTSAT